MIFVTTGFQKPFDRLIKAMDEIASDVKGIEMIAQVSKTDYRVKNMKSLDFVSPEEFTTYLQKATLIVSHAGMGTIISAFELERPIIIMPRLVKFGEVTTDHQLATAKNLEKLSYIHVAYNADDLKARIFELLKTEIKPLYKIKKYASNELINSIKSFIYPAN